MGARTVYLLLGIFNVVAGALLFFRPLEGLFALTLLMIAALLEMADPRCRGPAVPPAERLGLVDDQWCGLGGDRDLLLHPIPRNQCRSLGYPCRHFVDRRGRRISAVRVQREDR